MLLPPDVTLWSANWKARICASACLGMNAFCQNAVSLARRTSSFPSSVFSLEIACESCVRIFGRAGKVVDKLVDKGRIDPEGPFC